MDCITPGSPVPRHCLPEFVQSHGHWVGAISPFILCQLFLLLRLIFPSTRVFSSDSALCIKWSKYWSFSFNISPSSVYSSLISFRIDQFEFLAAQRTLKILFQHHYLKASNFWRSVFFIVQLSPLYMTIGITIASTIQIFVDKVMSLLCNRLSKFVRAYPRFRSGKGHPRESFQNGSVS